MKKIIFLISMVLVVCMSGCSGSKTYKSWVFSVGNGDSIKIELETTNGYDMISELPIKISQDGNVLSQCTFIRAEYYEQYVEVVEQEAASTVIDSGEKDGNTYVFWEYDGSEYNYVIMLGESNTAVLLANNVSKESAQECFNRLVFSVEE